MASNPIAQDSTKDVTDAAYKPRTGTLGTGSKYNAGKYGVGTSKYGVGVHQFPSDLFSNKGQYGGNWVTFYINVSSGSKLIKDKLVTTTNADFASMRGNFNPNGSGASTKDLVIGMTVGSAAIGGIAGQKGIVGGALGAFGGALVTSVSAGGANKPYIPKTTSDIPQLPVQKRITDTIALTIPNNFSARYSVEYEGASAAVMAGMAIAGGASADVVSALASGSTAALSKLVEAGGVGAAAATAAVLATPGIGDFASKASGLAANPKKEQIFKGVEFRTFSFEYTFAPRNENESKEIADIIRLFKLHMHPEFKDSHGFLFIYPSEFDIYYYHGETENMNLPRHTSCVLTDCNVNYTPNNQFSTFASANGTPGGAATQIQLSLTFKELAILTKDQILDGF